MNADKPRRRLVDFHEAPEWIADNRYLQTGYRKEGQSVREYVLSLFHLHNETCNIWLHFLGALFFVAVGFYVTALFAPAPTVHAHLEPAAPHRFASAMHSHHQDLAAVLDRPDPAPSVLEALSAKFQAVEESIVDYYGRVVPLVEGKAERLVQSLRKNSRNLVRRIKEFKLGSLAGGADAAGAVERARAFLRECLHPGRLGPLLHLEPHHLERYPLVVFLVGAVSCLGFSALFHWFHPINKTVCKVLHKLDYAGISLLNFGSSFASFFYYFYCDAFKFYFSIAFIGVGCFGTFAVSLTDWIDLPQHTTFKGLMYGFLGISNLVPAVFIAYLMYHAGDDNDHIPLGAEFFLTASMGATYLFGLVFYILKIPERWVPRKFDLWCNSHAIWHFFVLLAALEHLASLSFLYEKRQDIRCVKC